MSLRPFSIVIPSRCPKNVGVFLTKLKEHYPTPPRVIIVSDGVHEWPEGIEVVPGANPFSFSANANLGIQAAGTDDVVLCNDDAYLQTHEGFDRLRTITPDPYALVSPKIIGRCANAQQRNIGKDVVETATDGVNFVCVYIPRSTIATIGLLDERFLVGTWEDNDYCRRIREAGLSIGICGACAVLHDEAIKHFEALPDYRKLLAENKQRFQDKWSPFRCELSICVCSIFSRTSYRHRLMAALDPQWREGVEFLLSVDAGAQSIGTKRQRMLEDARGDFIVFLDDDDLVVPDYVDKVLAAIRRNPTADCITYRSKRFCDGHFEGDCIYSLTNEVNRGWTTSDGVRTYLRYPYHVTPIRRSKALQVGFPSINHGEDTDFADKLRPLLKTEEFINECLYFYYWRSDRSAEVTHRSRTK